MTVKECVLQNFFFEFNKTVWFLIKKKGKNKKKRTFLIV